MKSTRSKRWNPESTANRYGKNNPSFKHGLSVRGGLKVPLTKRTVYQKNRDEIKSAIIEKVGCLSCERCGIVGNKIETHHIVYRSEKPFHEHIHDKRNLIIVCVPCHNWYHKSKGNRDKIVEQRGLAELFGNDILNKSKDYAG